MSDCPDESELAALLEGLADPTLRRRIDAHIAGCSRCAAVLAAYVREGGGTRSEWGETSAARPSSQAPDDGLADGATLGRFVVLGRLGAGAMGIVYLAHDRQLDRRVAIKLVRAALLVHPDSRARLLREAQAMARISHPNVIAVYEAGEHADQIYVVMELIKGVTLRTWLGQARGWREVLACFLQAGRGLAAAHTAGLVHRDFKPDNVLVSARGEVKVTDFGLARALEAGDGWADTVTGGTIPTHDRSLAFDRSLTAAGVAIGTPAYMSPEQIEGRADARSDQFSFCVALWEALYGQRPFTGATIAEVWHKVGAGAFTPVPRDIKVPMHVQAALRRGLAVRAEARFADLDALLATLADDPAARRRRIAASVGLAGGLIVAGLALARGEAATAPTCAGAPERLHGAWDASRRSVVRDALLATGQGRAADTWARVAATLDDYAARWAEAHLETCLAHQRGEQSGAALDLRMSCLEHRRGELAALTDALTTIDAAALDEAARGAASLRPLAACADLTALQRRAEQVTPPSSERAPMVAAVRAEIDAAEARERTGQYAAGLVRVDRALKRAGTLVYEPLAAEARLARGRLLERLGRYEEADADLGAALAAADRAGHDEVRAEAAVWRLAVSGQRLARHDEAARWAELAGAIVDRVAAPPDLRSRFYRTRGALELERGEYAAALTTYERALAQGGVSPGERAAALGGVSSVHVALGDNPAAEQRLLQALPLLERTLGPHHPELGLVLNNLGNVQSYQGRRAEALATFERGLSLREQALGPAHPLTAALRLNHGGQLAQVGRFDEALAQLRRARADLVAAHGPRHPHIAYADANLGEVLVARGERDAARLAFQSALALREQLLGPDHPDLGTLLVSLGELALESGGLVEAEAAFSRAIALYTADPSHPHFDLPSARAGLGRVALARGRLTEAITSLAEAEAAAVASDLDPLRIASIRFALAQALGATQADLARARTLAGLAEAALVDGGPPRAAELAQVRAWLTGHPS